MNESTTNQGSDCNGAGKTLGSVAGELKSESDRLVQLTAQVEADQKLIAALTTERDRFRRLAHAWAAKQCDERQPPVPDSDVQTLANEENALPLGAFIEELERIAQGNG